MRSTLLWGTLILQSALNPLRGPGQSPPKPPENRLPLQGAVVLAVPPTPRHPLALYASPSTKGQIAERVSSIARVNGALWIKVRVFMGSACDYVTSQVPEVILGEGWVPAHLPSGDAVLWFEEICD